MVQHILVLCVGNICRSPVGEVLLKHHFQATGQSDKTVQSAGLSALVGQGADPHSVSVMRDRNIDLSAHIAQQVTLDLVRQHDLILVMESIHLDDVIMRYPFARGKAFRMGHWRNLDIQDPYRQPLSGFEKMAENLVHCVSDWIPYLS